MINFRINILILLVFVTNVRLMVFDMEMCDFDWFRFEDVLFSQFMTWDFIFLAMLIALEKLLLLINTIMPWRECCSQF